MTCGGVNQELLGEKGEGWCLLPTLYWLFFCRVYWTIAGVAWPHAVPANTFWGFDIAPKIDTLTF